MFFYLTKVVGLISTKVPYLTSAASESVFYALKLQECFSSF